MPPQSRYRARPRVHRQAMRSLTSLHESRVYSPENFWSPVQKDFCNNIGTKRTHRHVCLFVCFWSKADIVRAQCARYRPERRTSSRVTRERVRLTDRNLSSIRRDRHREVVGCFGSQQSVGRTVCDTSPKALPRSTSLLAACQIRCELRQTKISEYLHTPLENFGRWRRGPKIWP